MDSKQISHRYLSPRSSTFQCPVQFKQTDPSSLFAGIIPPVKESSFPTDSYLFCGRNSPGRDKSWKKLLSTPVQFERTTMIILLLFLNFAISWFNSWSVGKSWAETKHIGGLPRFMTWMGAIMASAGFSWCYLIVLAFIAGPDGLNKLPPKYVQAMCNLGYLALIIPVIGSGTAITIQSLVRAWKERSLASGGIAAWNTFADVYNISQAVEHVPGAFEDVADVLFSKDDKDEDDSAAARLAILLVCLAIAGGIITAALIIRSVSKSAVRAARLDLQVRRIARAS